MLNDPNTSQFNQWTWWSLQNVHTVVALEDNWLSFTYTEIPFAVYTIYLRPTGAYLTWGNGQTYWCLSHLRKWTVKMKFCAWNDYSFAMLSEKYCCNCVCNFSKYLLIIHIPKLRMPHAFSPHWNYAMKGLSQERIKQKNRRPWGIFVCLSSTKSWLVV